VTRRATRSDWREIRGIVGTFLEATGIE